MFAAAAVCCCCHHCSCLLPLLLFVTLLLPLLLFAADVAAAAAAVCCCCCLLLIAVANCYRMIAATAVCCHNLLHLFFRSQSFLLLRFLTPLVCKLCSQMIFFLMVLSISSDSYAYFQISVVWIVLCTCHLHRMSYSVLHSKIPFIWYTHFPLKLWAFGCTCFI